MLNFNGVIVILICFFLTLGISYKTGYNNGQKDLLNGKVKYEQVLDTNKVWKKIK